MYTTEQLDIERKRFAKASKAEVTAVKRAFHFKPFLSDAQQARLFAATERLTEIRAEENRERSRARYKTHKIDTGQVYKTRVPSSS